MTDPIEPVSITNRLTGGGYLLIPDSLCDASDTEWILIQSDPLISAKIPTDPTDLTPVTICADGTLLSTLTADQIKQLLSAALAREDVR